MLLGNPSLPLLTSSPLLCRLFAFLSHYSNPHLPVSSSTSLSSPVQHTLTYTYAHFTAVACVCMCMCVHSPLRSLIKAEGCRCVCVCKREGSMRKCSWAVAQLLRLFAIRSDRQQSHIHHCHLPLDFHLSHSPTFFFLSLSLSLYPLSNLALLLFFLLISSEITHFVKSCISQLCPS